MPPQDEIERLRAELDEWRRRAQVAEAIAIERLARAEAAERALRAAEAALAPLPDDLGSMTSGPTAGGDAEVPAERRPATLRERWRRYTETIN